MQSARGICLRHSVARGLSKMSTTWLSGRPGAPPTLLVVLNVAVLNESGRGTRRSSRCSTWSRSGLSPPDSTSRSRTLSGSAADPGCDCGGSVAEAAFASFIEDSEDIGTVRTVGEVARRDRKDVGHFVAPPRNHIPVVGWHLDCPRPGCRAAYAASPNARPILANARNEREPKQHSWESNVRNREYVD